LPAIGSYAALLFIKLVENSLSEKQFIKETGIISLLPAPVQVHLVLDEGMDTGPIILQKCVEVEESETSDSLRLRLNAIEDVIGPRAIELFARGRLKTEGRKVQVID